MKALIPSALPGDGVSRTGDRKGVPDGKYMLLILWAIQTSTKDLLKEKYLVWLP